MVLDLVFKLSSLKVEKGEAGDTLRAGDVLLKLSSLKAEMRRRKIRPDAMFLSQTRKLSAT